MAKKDAQHQVIKSRSTHRSLFQKFCRTEAAHSLLVKRPRLLPFLFTPTAVAVAGAVCALGKLCEERVNDTGRDVTVLNKAGTCCRSHVHKAVLSLQALEKNVEDLKFVGLVKHAPLAWQRRQMGSMGSMVDNVHTVLALDDTMHISPTPSLSPLLPHYSHSH